MKKKLLAFLMLFALALSAFGGLTAFADVSLEECDRCFQTAVGGFLERDDVEGNTVTAVRTPVYDINLQHLGYVYEFEIIGGAGYAIIICDDGNYIAQEFVPHTQSPYAQVSNEELCVYVNSMTYLKHNGTAFCDIQTSAEISPDLIEILSENAICYQQTDYPTQDQQTIKVYYTSRSYDSDYLTKRIPHYTNPGDLVNACAAVAGTNILGFYDRYYDNLIPNFTAGIEAYGMYLYNLPDDNVYNAMRELYSDMNGNANGISETNFKSGLQTYCAKKNLSCDFTQLLSSGILNFSSVKQCISENKPLALLLSTYTVTKINGYNGYDSHIYNMFYGNHIMVGFGYYEINYTLTDGSSANYQYVKVASGLGDPDEGFFNINYCTNINSAYKVYIH